MIPPTSGREHDPSAQPEASSEASSAFRAEEGNAPEEYLSSAPPFPLRIKILFFGLLVGGVIAVIYSALQAWLLRAAADSPFAQETFFRTFLTFLAGAVPWFILIATLAAAAEALVRRGERDARATRGVLKTLGQRTRHALRHVPAAPERSAQEIVEPLKHELNLELDPPTRRP